MPRHLMKIIPTFQAYTVFLSFYSWEADLIIVDLHKAAN